MNRPQNKLAKHGPLFLLMVMEHFVTRALDALTTLALIRCLNLGSFAVFVVYQSWTAALLLLFPSLENIFYREYGTLRGSGRLAAEFTVFKSFNHFKLLLALMLVLIGSTLSISGATHDPTAQNTVWFARVTALGLAFALPLAQALYGIYREPLRFELKQGTIVAITIAQKCAILAGIYLAGRYSGGQIQYIALTAIGLFFAFGGIWAMTAKALLPDFRKAPKIPFSQTYRRIMESMKTVILWIHFNGAATIAIQTLDVYFLSRAKTDLREVAVYSIALKAANFFQMIPMPFAQVFNVYLGRKSNVAHKASESRKLVWLATLFFTLLGFAMWGIGIVFAKFILGFLARGKFTPDELIRGEQYFKWQLLGIALYLICFASGSYVINRGNIRKFSLSVFVPWLIFSAIAYAWAAHISPLAAAQMNVPVYLFCAVGHLIFFGFWMKKLKN